MTTLLPTSLTLNSFSFFILYHYLFTSYIYLFVYFWPPLLQECKLHEHQSCTFLLLCPQCLRQYPAHIKHLIFVR